MIFSFSWKMFTTTTIDSFISQQNFKLKHMEHEAHDRCIHEFNWLVRCGSWVPSFQPTICLNSNLILASNNTPIYDEWQCAQFAYTLPSTSRKSFGRTSKWIVWCSMHILSGIWSHYCRVLERWQHEKVNIFSFMCCHFHRIQFSQSLDSWWLDVGCWAGNFFCSLFSLLLLTMWRVMSHSHHSLSTNFEFIISTLTYTSYDVVVVGRTHDVVKRVK